MGNTQQRAAKATSIFGASLTAGEWMPMDTYKVIDMSFDSNTSSLATKTRHPADPVPRLFWTLEETAARLGLSVRSFFALREKHPLYAPDGSRTIIDDPKKDMPLWSDDLVRLIAFARSISTQGVRQLSDDEAFRVRSGLGETRRREYLTFAE